MGYLIIILLVAGGDLAAKLWIETVHKEKEDQEILGGEVTITKSHNTGAVLNFLEEKKEWVKLISTGMLGSLLGVFAFVFGKKNHKFLKAALSFTIGGAISNVFDRIKRGYVVDYISFKRIKNVVFNIGDFFIFLGTFMFAIYALFHKES